MSSVSEACAFCPGGLQGRKTPAYILYDASRAFTHPPCGVGVTGCLSNKCATWSGALAGAAPTSPHFLTLTTYNKEIRETAASNPGSCDTDTAAGQTRDLTVISTLMAGRDPPMTRLTWVLGRCIYIFFQRNSVHFQIPKWYLHVSDVQVHGNVRLPAPMPPWLGILSGRCPAWPIGKLHPEGKPPPWPPALSPIDPYPQRVQRGPLHHRPLSLHVFTDGSEVRMERRPH